jgi:hypothetical protein
VAGVTVSKHALGLVAALQFGRGVQSAVVSPQITASSEVLHCNKSDRFPAMQVHFIAYHFLSTFLIRCYLPDISLGLQFIELRQHSTSPPQPSMLQHLQDQLRRQSHSFAAAVDTADHLPTCTSCKIKTEACLNILWRLHSQLHAASGRICNLLLNFAEAKHSVVASLRSD